VYVSSEICRQDARIVVDNDDGDDNVEKNVTLVFKFILIDRESVSLCVTLYQSELYVVRMICSRCLYGRNIVIINHCIDKNSNGACTALFHL